MFDTSERRLRSHYTVVIYAKSDQIVSKVFIFLLSPLCLTQKTTLIKFACTLRNSTIIVRP